MILEGILTTLNADGSPNIAPMGPRVDEGMHTLILRPYQDSQTFENLQRSGEGVFHVTDDVLLLARAAIDQIESPPLRQATSVEGWILADACRWYALRVRECDRSQPRATFVADVVDRGRERDFFGLNRAKHAVVEAAILATRIRHLPLDDILAQYRNLQTLVDKTGGPDEQAAMMLLKEHVDKTSPNRFE